MRNGEKGFTFIEILIVMAVGGMLLSGLVTAIFQVLNITQSTTTEITAFENIKNAAYRITQDVKKANTTNLVDGGPVANALTLNWTIWYDTNGNLIPNGEAHSSQFSLSGTDLQRNYDGSISTIGKYIASVQFSRQGSIIVVGITASPEGRTETAEQSTYYVYLQSKETPVR